MLQKKDNLSFSWMNCQKVNFASIYMYLKHFINNYYFTFKAPAGSQMLLLTFPNLFNFDKILHLHACILLSGTHSEFGAVMC